MGRRLHEGQYTYWKGIFNLPKLHVTDGNGFKPYSQSKKARTGSLNIPLGINFEIGDETFMEWKQQFKVSTVKF